MTVNNVGKCVVESHLSVSPNTTFDHNSRHLRLCFNTSLELIKLIIQKNNIFVQFGDLKYKLFDPEPYV